MKICIPIHGDDVAPRFDLASEVVLAESNEAGKITSARTIVLPHASPEELCSFLLKEGVELLLCGGIEDQYYQYLHWKKVRVRDSIMLPWEEALNREVNPGRE